MTIDRFAQWYIGIVGSASFFLFRSKIHGDSLQCYLRSHSGSYPRI